MWAKPFKFMSYNIDTNIGRIEEGYARESHKEWRVVNRMPGIIELLSEIDADIVNIQEARKFTNSIGEDVDSLTPLLNYFNESDHEAIEAGYNPTALSFHFITAFKRSRFSLIETKIHYLTKTPDEPTFHEDLKGKTKEEIEMIKQTIRDHNYGEEWEKSILINKLLDKETGDIIYVFNIHLGFNETHRFKSSELIRDLAQKIIDAEPSSKIIISGDFNSFTDKGGKEQIESILSTKTLQELSDPLHLPNTDMRLPNDLTFIAFPYDFFFEKIQEFMKNGRFNNMTKIDSPMERKKEISSMFSESPCFGGKLDHIFAYGLNKVGQAITYLKPTTKPYPENYEEETIKDYILNVCENKPAFYSDHQPLVVVVE